MKMTDEQIVAAAKAIDTPHGPITLIHTRDDGQEVPTLMARQFVAALDTEPPEGYVMAPHFRGYALLGIGAYLINSSAPGSAAEIVLSIATEEEKAGRVVGDLRDNAPGTLIQPEVIAVRIGFDNVAGLDALEQHLRILREEHFPESISA